MSIITDDRQKGVVVTEDTPHVVFQSKEWFDENAFKDMDNRYWETKTLRDDYDLGEEFELNIEMAPEYKCISHDWCSDTVLVDLNDMEDMMWGVKAVVTLRHQPEYFV